LENTDIYVVKLFLYLEIAVVLQYHLLIVFGAKF